jgi:hypothetical protein
VGEKNGKFLQRLDNDSFDSPDSCVSDCLCVVLRLIWLARSRWRFFFEAKKKGKKERRNGQSHSAAEEARRERKKVENHNTQKPKKKVFLPAGRLMNDAHGIFMILLG